MKTDLFLYYNFNSSANCCVKYFDREFVADIIIYVDKQKVPRQLRRDGGLKSEDDRKAPFVDRS